ncbi:MAG: hypothetical protein Q9227_007107 [Pyrenula ochraceoflavens]
MVLMSVGYTAPVNSPDITKKITLDQLWESMHQKIKAAQDFVPIFKDTKVLESPTPEHPTRTLRLVIADEGAAKKAGMAAITMEEVFANKPGQVEFYQTPIHSKADLQFLTALSDRVASGERLNIKAALKALNPDVYASKPENLVQNIITTDANDNLYMTYTFKQEHEGLQAGSKEEEEIVEHLKGVAKAGVEGTLKTIRSMIDDGRL